MPQTNDFSQPPDSTQPSQSFHQEKFSLKVLKSIPLSETIKVIGDWVAEHSEEKKEDIVKQISSTSGVAVNVGNPSEHTRDLLWTIVIIAFAVVFVGAFITLAFGVLMFGQRVNPDLVLTMFMSVAGFLAGLFTPSPVANRGRNTNS